MPDNTPRKKYKEPQSGFKLGDVVDLHKFIKENNIKVAENEDESQQKKSE